jgi:nucleoside-diphosphate-sugar epimerase
MHNSALINLNMAAASIEARVGKLFYASSACIYPEYNQMDPYNPNCAEGSEYPADPDSEYGWEKLFSERLYTAFQRNHDLDIRIARFHNIFGPLGTWTGGREKVPAALCRKVAEASENGQVAVWGDGQQTRSFLYIEECIEAIMRFMESDFSGPVNIGSDEIISINDLARLIAEIAGKNIAIKHIEGPLGVRGRNSDNTLIREKLGWAPARSLRYGLEKTYSWIGQQVDSSQAC